MKTIIASDIHGSEYYCKKLVERFEEEQAERMFLLGDILYHGPRNDLPKDYCPKGVISLLNPLAAKILCVKGNCESEVDGMVLDFSAESDSAQAFFENGVTLYLTHGHKTVKNIENSGCVLVSGHTHVPVFEVSENGFARINPGSVSIPKEGSCNSFVVFDGTRFTWKNVCDGKAYMEYELKI